MNCDLWVQLDNDVSFVEEEVYVCIICPEKTVCGNHLFLLCHYEVLPL